MNTIFGDMAKRVEAFDPLKEAIDATHPAADDIIAENQSQLYDRGIRSDGETLGEYSPFTIQRKKDDGERYDHVTLRDTGLFYSSMKVRFDKDSFRITANDKKIDEETGEPVYLTDIYGDEILGLTDEVLDFIIHNTTRPNMQSAFRAKILI